MAKPKKPKKKPVRGKKNGVGKGKRVSAARPTRRK